MRNVETRSGIPDREDSRQPDRSSSETIPTFGTRPAERRSATRKTARPSGRIDDQSADDRLTEIRADRSNQGGRYRTGGCGIGRRRAITTQYRCCRAGAVLLWVAVAIAGLRLTKKVESSG